MQRSTSPPPLARRVFPDRAAGLLLSPERQGLRRVLVPMFSRGRATASIELPSERPALAVLLLRVLPFSSGRSRLNDWRRSDRRLQPNSGFQRWRTACGRGPVIPIRDDGAPGEASSFPRHAAAVPFLGTPSRAGRRPRGPLPYRPPSCFQAPHTFRRALRELRSPIFPGGAQGCLQVHRATCDSWSTPAGCSRAGRIRILPTPDAALAPAVIVACVPGWDGPRGQRDDRDLPRHTVPGTVLWLRSGAFDRHRSAGHPARRPPFRASSSRRTVPSSTASVATLAGNASVGPTALRGSGDSPCWPSSPTG